MTQEKTYKNKFLLIWSSESNSFDRFIFSLFYTAIFFCLIALNSCGKPDIKLNRLERRYLDTLINHQLDSISPILDSICSAEKETVIQHAVDSIVLERRKKEERLRNRVIEQ